MRSTLNKYQHVNTWHKLFCFVRQDSIKMFSVCLFVLRQLKRCCWLRCRPWNIFHISNSWNIDAFVLLIRHIGETLKYDVNFRGPLSKRSCTDVCCLFIFIVFCVAWGCIARYGKYPLSEKIALCSWFSPNFNLFSESKIDFDVLLLFFLCLRASCVQQLLTVI